MKLKIEKKEKTVADILKEKKQEQARADKKSKKETERKRHQEEQDALPPWMRKKKLTAADKRIEEQQKRFLEEISNVYIVSIACRNTGISRATLYRWVNEYTDFKREFKKRQSEGKWAINDLAESQLIKKMKDGDSKMIIFYLKCSHPSYRNTVLPIVEERQGLTLEQKLALGERLAKWKAVNLHSDTDYTTNPTK